jgi:3-oxoacid CoA-transferase B subunit
MIMRGGHLDISVLGAFQVGANGDLANWATDDEDFPPAVGGAMDLAVGARRILVLTTHITSRGEPKLLERCTYPLTAAGVVDRVYTDLAVLDVTPEGLLVRELVDGLTRDGLQELTGSPLRFAENLRVLAPQAWD